MMTYGELYKKCKEDLNITAEVCDYRPASKIHGTDDINNAIIIWFQNGSKLLYILDELNNIWDVQCLEKPRDSTYEEFLNMTNKEAAEILKNILIHVNMGRGNGKTISILKHQAAIAKAIKVLEENPESDFSQFMNPPEEKKEEK